MEPTDTANHFQLDGQIALITGGSRGLGLSIAQALADHGADIVLLARDADRLAVAADELRLQGTGVWTYVLDLREHDRIEETYKAICAETGGVDILVNNAAVMYRAAAEWIELEQWKRLIDVGLHAVMALSQCFARERIASERGGRIINIGSLMCHGGRPDTAAYTTMKTGLHGLTRALAIEWAKHAITVNTLAPGYFITDATRVLADKPEFDAWVRASTPAERWGELEDLGGPAVFLASPASSFVTGQILYVDGGWTAAL